MHDFQGTLLGDGYSGYQKIDVRSDGASARAACAPHARRTAFDAREFYPLKSSWSQAQFQHLDNIEDRVKGMSEDERVALRHRAAASV